MAASESEFSMSSSSKSPSGGVSPRSASSPPARTGAGLNGMAAAGAAGGAIVCASAGVPGIGTAAGAATTGSPSGPIAGIGRVSASGRA